MVKVKLINTPRESTFPMYGAVFFQYTFKLLIKKKILLGKDDFTCAGGDLCE